MKRVIFTAVATLLSSSAARSEIKNPHQAHKSVAVGTVVKATYFKDNGREATIEGRVFGNNDYSIQVGYFPYKYATIPHDNLLSLSVVTKPVEIAVIFADLLECALGPILTIGTFSLPKLGSPERRLPPPGKPRSSQNTQLETFEKWDEPSDFSFGAFKQSRRKSFGLF